MFPVRRRLAAFVLPVLAATIVASCSGAATPTPSTAASVASLPPASVASASAAPSASEVAASASASAAPSVAASPSPVTFPLTVTDDNNTSVTVPAQPSRVVSLTPAVTEILFAIGAGNEIVARSEDPTPYPAAAAKIPAVTNMGKVDIEKIVAAKPDLVIAGGDGFTPDDAIAKLRSLGMPVVVEYAPDVKTVYADMRLTADLVGLPAQGDALATKGETDMNAISAAATAATTTQPRVFYEIDASDAIYGPADKSFLAQMIQMAGGNPITTGDPNLYSMPLEKLIAADPQVIVLGDAAYGATAAAVAKRPGWGVMTAVKTNAIRPIDDVVVTRPGPRLAEGLRDLVLAINPQAVVPSPAP